MGSKIDRKTCPPTVGGHVFRSIFWTIFRARFGCHPIQENRDKLLHAWGADRSFQWDESRRTCARDRCVYACACACVRVRCVHVHVHVRGLFRCECRRFLDVSRVVRSSGGVWSVSGALWSCLSRTGLGTDKSWLGGIRKMSECRLRTGWKCLRTRGMKASEAQYACVERACTYTCTCAVRLCTCVCMCAVCSARHAPDGR